MGISKSRGISKTMVTIGAIESISISLSFSLGNMNSSNRVSNIASTGSIAIGNSGANGGRSSIATHSNGSTLSRSSIAIGSMGSNGGSIAIGSMSSNRCGISMGISKSRGISKTMVTIGAIESISISLSFSLGNMNSSNRVSNIASTGSIAIGNSGAYSCWCSIATNSNGSTLSGSSIAISSMGGNRGSIGSACSNRGGISSVSNRSSISMGNSWSSIAKP